MRFFVSWLVRLKNCSQYWWVIDKAFQKTLQNTMFVKLQIAARDVKTKVSIFSLLFAFRWFLAQKTIIPVPPIVNLQKKQSDYEFLKKSCVRCGNCNLGVQDAKSFCLNIFVTVCILLVFGTKLCCNYYLKCNLYFKSSGFWILR